MAKLTRNIIWKNDAGQVRVTWLTLDEALMAARFDEAIAIVEDRLKALQTAPLLVGSTGDTEEMAAKAVEIALAKRRADLATLAARADEIRAAKQAALDLMATDEPLRAEAARLQGDENYAGWTPVAYDMPTPERDEYRDSWRWGGDKPAVDIEAAREVHKNIIRRRREPMLREADAAVNIALDSGDAAAEKAARQHRQRLRDATKDRGIADAVSLADLRAAVPAVLVGK
jgi:hypothetical protein